VILKLNVVIVIEKDILGVIKRDIPDVCVVDEVVCPLQ
jgi:hypothetical protein